MNKIIVTSIILAFSGFVAPIAGAAPSMMQCPQMLTNTFNQCSYRGNPGEVLYFTISNNALSFANPQIVRTTTAQVGSNGTGVVSIYSNTIKGQVTVCAYDITRAFKSCSITRVL
jgi:hypothetical protein